MAREVGTAGFDYPGYVVPLDYHDQKFFTFAELRAAHALPLHERIEKIMSTAVPADAKWIVATLGGNNPKSHGPFDSRDAAVRFGDALAGREGYEAKALLAPPQLPDLRRKLDALTKLIVEYEDTRATVAELVRTANLYQLANWG